MLALFSGILIAVLLYQQASLRIWTLVCGGCLLLLSALSHLSFPSLIGIWTLFFLVAILFNFRGLRRKLISQHLLPIYKRLMPHLSDTEAQALDAGTVGFEAEIFRGHINWAQHFNTPLAQLSAAEQAFIDGPVAQLCAQIDDWQICHVERDLPATLWEALKTLGFFGLIIPTQYGGKGFSALAHSEILLRLYSRSTAVATTVAVPNSLGPAELLLHYGTTEQKDTYLPRLAAGVELPCFALTGPEAGSDAGAIPDYGVVGYGQWQGAAVLGIKLNWRKRYITLAPVATVLGLAFKLFDPEHLLSSQTDRGICCALIPVTTPGIHIGRRHIPLDIPFQNGPTEGVDVFIPLSCLIGGEAMIGHGWRMLVECLSVGRAITLPTSAIAATKLCASTSGAYARIRRQFNMAIGFFEGIQAPLARLAANAYWLDATRHGVLSAIDRGEKPAVVSAMIKYHATEAGRLAVCDAMDIHGGKGICLGPNNYLGRFYQGAPIAITVEGANILTRNMIIFGQGAIRCHPFVLAEYQAAQLPDRTASLKAFDRVLFSHIGYSLSNISRSLFLSLSDGYTARVKEHGAIKRYAQKIQRLSANFALAADAIMCCLGGELKRKEALSARLGDVFSLLYFCAATLKRFKAEASPSTDLPLLHYCCQDLLHRAATQLDALLKNLAPRWLAISLRCLIFPLGTSYSPPSDALQQQVAQLLLTPGECRDRICRGIDLTESPHNAIVLLNQTLAAVVANESLEKRLRQAIREGRVTGWLYPEQITAAAEQGLITRGEAQDLHRLNGLRAKVIDVDDFAVQRTEDRRQTTESGRLV